MPSPEVSSLDLRRLTEFGLIARIRRTVKLRSPRVAKGVGDDCAVIRDGRGRFLLITSDLLIEGIHFRLAFTDPVRLGTRALAVNLSDVAAMGGRPLFYLVGLALPSRTQVSFVDGLYAGMESLAATFQVSMVGGDTCRSDRLMIAISLVGEVGSREIVTRAGARPGDRLFVTGTLGDSALGLKILKRCLGRRRSGLSGELLERLLAKTFPGGDSLFLVERHLSPPVRLLEGQALSRLASSMIDLSDGLLSDVTRICEESRVGAEVRVEGLPLSPAFRKIAPLFPGNPVDLALAGGEDYELLFTVPQGRVPLLDGLRHRVPFTEIGGITGESGRVAVVGPGGRLRAATRRGYDHFGAA